MQQVKVDYIIVGQGLAGSWLSYELIKRGYTVLVFDEVIQNTSSQKAAGLYNPITGRKMIKTWRAEDLFSTLERDYKDLEKLLSHTFIHPMPIYRPFAEVADSNDWQGRLAEDDYAPFINEITGKSRHIRHVNDPHGGIMIQNCGYVDVPLFIKTMRSFLIEQDVFVSGYFNSDEVNVENCSYKNWKAHKILFCEGVAHGSLWAGLPFRPVRGELMDIACVLETDSIINQGVFIIPKGNGRFTVGSTYDHKILTHEPQDEGIEQLCNRLKKILKVDFDVVEKRAGIRPATHDRKPYIGFHSKHKNFGIFNGLGTKGVSLAPYFARHFVDVLEGKKSLDLEVDVQRVYA